MEKSDKTSDPCSPYRHGEVPADYYCDECYRVGVKLWREYQSWTISLLCFSCACASENKRMIITSQGKMRDSLDLGRGLDIITDCIGYRVPAVPVMTERGYYGYTSIPALGGDWWYKLPYFSNNKFDNKKEGTE